MNLSRRNRVLILVMSMGLMIGAHALRVPGIPDPLRPPDEESSSIFPPERLRTLWLGIRPYLAAATIWLLLSGLIPRLRRVREGTRGQRVAFDHGIVWLALVISVVMGTAGSTYIESLFRLHGGAAPVPSAVWIVTTVAAAMGTIGAAILLTRAGIGNGVAWIALSTYVVVLIESVPVELAYLRESGASHGELPIAMIVVTGIVAIGVFYVRSAHDLRVVPLEGTDRFVPGSVPSLPLRMNLAGIVPVLQATGLIAILKMLGVSQWDSLPAALSSTLFALLTLATTYFCIVVGYDTRRVAPMLERFGCRLDVPDGASTEDYLNRRLRGRAFLSVAILMVIVLVCDTWLEAMAGVSPASAGLSGEFVLIACAIVLETRRHFIALGVEAEVDSAGSSSQRAPRGVGGGNPDAREIQARPERGSDSRSWVDVFESDVEFECRLALAVLQAKDIRGVVSSNRVIPLTGTLAFWEWTTPRFPSLMIHRRLAGGRVTVRVPESRAADARDVLAELQGSLS